MAARAIPRSRRRLLIAIAAVIVLAFIALNVLSTFYVDLLWFREVHFSGVFWTALRAKILLGLIFGVIFFALLLANLVIVRRLTPRFRPFSPEQEASPQRQIRCPPKCRTSSGSTGALMETCSPLTGLGCGE